MAGGTLGAAALRDFTFEQPKRRRFRRARKTADIGWRAVTLGPSHDDWAVVSPTGEVVYRGYAMYAARMASELTAKLHAAR